MIFNEIQNIGLIHHIISFHIISYHITSHHIISYHIYIYILYVNTSHIFTWDVLGYLNDSLQIKFSEPVFCSVTDVIWKKLLGPRHAKYAFRFGMGLTFGHADLSLTWNDLTYQLTLPARYLPFRRIFADMGTHMFFLYQPTVVDMFGHVWICFCQKSQTFPLVWQKTPVFSPSFASFRADSFAQTCCKGGCLAPR